MEDLKDMNYDKLSAIVKIIKLTADNLVNKEVDGVLKKPTTIAESERFNSNLNTLIVSRLRKNFGV